jgi:hypothetical protein
MGHHTRRESNIYVWWKHSASVKKDALFCLSRHKNCGRDWLKEELQNILVPQYLSKNNV